eukprot:358152-Chlamydomonas_euryale.AAC.9
MVHGVNVVAMQANGVADMTLPEDAEAELGIVDASKARRHDKKMPRGPHVPEAAGLPVDDQFMHPQRVDNNRKCAIPGMRDTWDAQHLTYATPGMRNTWHAQHLACATPAAR